MRNIQHKIIRLWFSLFVVRVCQFYSNMPMKLALRVLSLFVMMTLLFVAEANAVLITWNGLAPSDGTNWNNAVNWTGGLPSSTDDVLIPAGCPFYPTLPNITTVFSMRIDAGGILDGGSSTTLTIDGASAAWDNVGTFNSGVSTVVFTNAAATMLGTTDFDNVTVNSGAGLTLQTNTIMRIGGTLSNSGLLDATAFANVVEYNGAAQIVVNPNGAIAGFRHLILNGSGVKTMPATALSILDDFSCSGTASATSGNNISVGGNFSIAIGSAFSIAPATTLTVVGTITNSSGASAFVLHSDVTGTASLIHSTDNVPATVKRFITGNAEDWHFLSSPVANQSISGAWLPAGTYGNGTGHDLYLWNEPSNCWIYNLDLTSTINWSTAHPSADFEVGRGYLYSLQALNPTKEFVGNLNNGAQTYGLTIGSVDLSLNGFNLVGNPYPSSIDWSAAAGWTRGALTSSGGGYDMWIWNPAVNNYGVFNSADGDGVGTNSVTQYIAPMQGFFVQASSAGSLSMNNSVRVHDGANLFKSLSSAGVGDNTLSLSVNAKNGCGADEVQLNFGYPINENGALKLFSTVVSAPSLYLPSNGRSFSVQYYTNTLDNQSIPIMFSAGANGNFEFKCICDFDAFDTILIEDCKTNYIHDLKLLKSYCFEAMTADNPNRFVLHFGTFKKSLNNDFPAEISTDGTCLIIDLALISKETDLKVYDLKGQLLLQKHLQGNVEHRLSLNTNTQIVVVSVKNSDGGINEKLIWTRN